MNKLLTTGFIGRKELNITYTNIAGSLNSFGTEFKRVHIILPGSYFAHTVHYYPLDVSQSSHFNFYLELFRDVFLE